MLTKDLKPHHRKDTLQTMRYNYQSEQFEFFRAYADGYQGWVTMNGMSNGSGSWGDRELNIEGVLEQTPPYDPRVDFRDYALQLSNDPNRSDCLKLALLAYKAGQIWFDGLKQGTAAVASGMLNGLTEFSSTGPFRGSSDRNFRVGVYPRDPNFGSGFRDTGFKPGYQDPPTDIVRNQVRHFTGWLAAGNQLGIPIANLALYDVEGTSDSRKPDVGLGETAIKMGATLANDFSPSKFAQDIWKNVCGESVPLNLP
jgi:hypothetical protein